MPDSRLFSQQAEEMSPDIKGAAMIGLSHSKAIAEICDLNWTGLDELESLSVVWAYYFFSVQFRENLQIARELFPEDEKLRALEKDECHTSNLSPWEGVAGVGERMNHDEFMRRALSLSPISEATRRQIVSTGEDYLRTIRAIDLMTRALSIASYEDGGLEQVFRAILTMPVSDNPALQAFRHFMLRHIEFDSDPDEGHGALARHLRPDERVTPLWTAFRDLFIEITPSLQATSPSR